MTLHCGVRLGFFDHVYSLRHEIAYGIGLIKEIPLAICGSQYDFSNKLDIVIERETDSIPQSIVKAKEINLFYISAFRISLTQEILFSNLKVAFLSNLYALDFSNPIFHPPTV